MLPGNPKGIYVKTFLNCCMPTNMGSMCGLDESWISLRRSSRCLDL